MKNHRKRRYFHWTALNWFNGENFELKNICCRLWRNDSRIRNIATETNHLVNKSFPTCGQPTALCILVSGVTKKLTGIEGRKEGAIAGLEVNVIFWVKSKKKWLWKDELLCMEIYTYAKRINMRRSLPVWPRFEKEEREDSATIAGFHMTSLKFQLQNYWSYWDFT